MNIGFTGTRKGMTPQQLGALRAYLRPYTGEFHHGDCIGADAQAHDEAKEQYRIIIHPPVDEYLRAHCSDAFYTHSPLPYLARNKNIVSQTNLLIAAPAEQQEQVRSGTWSTIRFARSLGRNVLILFPSGEVRSES